MVQFCFRSVVLVAMGVITAGAMAQTTNNAVNNTAKDAASNSAKPASANKPVAKPAPSAVAAPAAARKPEALSNNQRDLAKQFYSGFLSCELGKFVILTPDERTPGYFVLSHKGQQYRVAPVESRTGTLRMEDNRGHAVWIQLPNKSMLMDQKAGVRLADECKSPEQEIVAKSYKTNPPQELLDSLKPGTIEARNAALRAEPPVVTPIQRPQVNPHSTVR
jgi:hypothetical protein